MNVGYFTHLLTSVIGFGLTYGLCQLIQPDGWRWRDYLAIFIPFILLTLLEVAGHRVNLPEIPLPLILPFLAFVIGIMAFPFRETWGRTTFVSSAFVLIYMVLLIAPYFTYSPE